MTQTHGHGTDPHGSGEIGASTRPEVP